MRIAVGSDHRGREFRRMIKRRLEDRGHEVVDMGAEGDDSVDYPDFAQRVARSVAQGQSERGVLICSSGIGMSIAANRFKGVRAALCLDVSMARTSREHNNANVLCLGQDNTPEQEVGRIVDAWMDTEFQGGRHLRRTRKLDSAC